jgi:Kelch motif
MKQRHLYALGLLVAVGLLFSSVPVFASAGRATAPRVPDVSVSWATTSPMPFAATRFDGEYVPQVNRVYIMGFRAADNSTDGSVWYYNVATNTWVDTTRDLPLPISNYQISMLRDARGLGLYVFGGRDNLGNLVKNVQVYYPQFNQVLNMTSDPYPGTTPSGCTSLPAMGVATLGNKAYVLGGVSFSAPPISCVDEASAQTWIFDPMAAPGARWTQGPSMNVARGYITPTVLGGRIYAIGGDTNVAGTLFASPTVEAWQPPAGGWNDGAIADLPVPCDESQAFPWTAGPLAGGFVLSTCGQWPIALGDTYYYSAGTNSWSLVGAVNEIRRNQAGSFIVVGGQRRMYILGGYAADGATALASTEQGIGGPLAGRPGFSRPGSHAGATASTN